MARTQMNTETRLLRHVNKNTKTGCWEWTGCKFIRGYGKTYDRCTATSKIRTEYAHRLMWKCVNGDPGSLCVLHKCDNPGCVNPEHLFLGTHADNMHDMALKGRSPSGKNHRGFAKLTEKDVRAIRASKLTYRALAYQYSVSENHIYIVRSRRSWAYV